MRSKHGKGWHMRRNLIKIFSLALLITLGLQNQGHSERAKPILSTYLTWDREDTTTTMVVNILTTEKPKNPELKYGTALQTLKGLNTKTTPTSHTPIENTPFYVTRFSLTKLTPDTTYFFNYSDETHAPSKEQFFHTLPDSNKTVEFVQGGDMSTNSELQKVSLNAITNDTMALLIGGDIAYADGDTKNHGRWTKWFTLMNNTMKTPDGRLIPLIVAVGNHEVNSKTSTNPFTRAPFYTNLFFQNKEISYFKRSLGPNNMIFVLDTGHLAKHDGLQKNWLENELYSSEEKNKFALYHVPLYPSFRSYNEYLSEKGRKEWLPLFDKYELLAAFENHDHVLKRTHMLKNNKKVSSQGTVYVGDGCWGASVRSANKQWYHHNVENKRHVWRVVTSKQATEFTAIGKNGEVFDHFSIENKQVIEK